jgi:hypothetical protein
MRKAEMEVYFSEDNELSELACLDKESRPDIYVRLQGSLYNVHALTIHRLIQEYEWSINMNGFYTVEPNLVLVQETSKKVILRTLDYLYEEGYFERVKPVSKIYVLRDGSVSTGTLDDLVKIK